MIHVTLTPGAKASSIRKGRLFNAGFGVNVDRDLIDTVFPQLSAEEIALYVTLLRYNDVKGEKDTPQLSDIKTQHFPNWSQEQFDKTLSNLKTVIVNDTYLVRIRATEN